MFFRFGPVIRSWSEPIGGDFGALRVDLVAERGDVLARFAERVRQLLVLADGGGELTLGLEQPLLQRVESFRRVREPGPGDCGGIALLM